MGVEEGTVPAVVVSGAGVVMIAGSVSVLVMVMIWKLCQ